MASSEGKDDDSSDEQAGPEEEDGISEAAEEAATGLAVRAAGMTVWAMGEGWKRGLSRRQRG